MRTWLGLFPLAGWIIILILLVWSCLSTWLRASNLLSGTTYLYVAHPIMLCIIAGISWRITRDKVSRVRRAHEKFAVVASVMALWAIIYFLSGLATTYTQNPLAGSMQLFIYNVIGYGAVVVMTEYIRWRVVLIGGRRHPVMKGLIIVLVFSILQCNLLMFYGLTLDKIIELSIAVIVPLFVHNVVATYLAYTVGFGAMVAYRLTWIILTIFLPIMPKYDWYMSGMAVLCVGVLVILMIDRTRQDRTTPLRFHRKHIYGVSNLLFFVSMLGLIFFMTGLFSYKPVAIMSNSMQPTYSRGDMVIVQKRGDHVDISIGDILQYQREGSVITHRIVGKETVGNGTVYTTKGDNNSESDPWSVTDEQILGTVRARIPLVGYPTVLLNEMMHK